ncbi:MAG: aspartate aminotransferase family protein [Proteobacteria bacterium]|nr:aspartate aminotransferase family protein [Pseudomonadota bacterium]
MTAPTDPDDLEDGPAPIALSSDEFRALGYRLVDRIAEFLETLPERPVMSEVTPAGVRALLGQGPMPEDGADPAMIIDEAASLIIDHNRLTGHPRQWGYIIGSAAPLGALGDLLAGAVNPNVVSWPSSPMATEIELQAVRWIADLLGYPADCGGLFTSGGNTANFIGFLAARRARADWDVRAAGIGDARRLRVYVSRETHTWIEKAADLFGLGTDAIRWIETDGALRMDVAALERQIDEDQANGDRPFLVVGTAGTVSTGAVDPLPALAALCRERGLWFHVDGAYGALAIVAPDAPDALSGLREADSIAVDAHKWLYAPLEGGCALVRDRKTLRDTFSYRPPYYSFPDDADESLTNFHECGLQNSRGFRALKVWMILRQLGRKQYARLVARDIGHARELHQRLDEAPDIEAVTQALSITTFRYAPGDLAPATEAVESYLDDLNAALLTRIQRSGEAYLSNAVVDGRFLLRACITNFRTTRDDVRALPEIVTRLGGELDAEMRPEALGRAGGEARR